MGARSTRAKTLRAADDRRRRLQGIAYALPVASAQVKSHCVLFAGMATPEARRRDRAAPTRDHTERMLPRAGARSSATARGDRACAGRIEVDAVHVPGDPSSIAFLAAAALLVAGSQLVLEDVNVNWTRIGFLRIAQRMGAVWSASSRSRSAASRRGSR